MDKHIQFADQPLEHTAAPTVASAPPSAPPPYDYNPHAHQAGRVGGLYLLPETYLKPEPDTSESAGATQNITLSGRAAQYEASLAEQIDKHADTVFKDILLPLSLILAEAAISTGKRYADDLKAAGVRPSKAYLSPETLEILDSTLPYFYAFLLGVMIYQKAIDERKINRVLINELRDQGLISSSSAKAFRQSPETIEAMLMRALSVICVAVGGTYISERNNLMTGLALIAGSSTFDFLRAYIESKQWMKLWNDNFKTKYRSHDEYAFQNKLRYYAVIPGVSAMVLGGYMISGLRHQRDGDTEFNNYITQTILTALLGREMIMLLGPWPLDAQKYELQEAIVREHVDTRGVTINTTKLFGTKMSLSTAYQVLDFLSKGSIVAAAALYTYQSQHEEDEFFPKASLALFSGIIAAQFMSTWNNIEAGIAGQINSQLRDKFKAQTATAFVSDNVGRAVEYISETTVVKSVVSYWRPKGGLYTPLLSPGEGAGANAHHGYGLAKRRTEL